MASRCRSRCFTTPKTVEPELTVYQEDLRKVGINMNLRLVTPETQFQMISNRNFQMVIMAWGGLLFPNPETPVAFLARRPERQQQHHRIQERARRPDLRRLRQDVRLSRSEFAAMREIDGILANDYQYALAVVRSHIRIAYWNKFGTPPGYLPRTGDSYRQLIDVVDRSGEGCRSCKRRCAIRP